MAIHSLVHIIEELGDDFPGYQHGFSSIARLAQMMEEVIPDKIRYLMLNILDPNSSFYQSMVLGEEKMASRCPRGNI